jgi:hypothetical protein
MRFIPTPIAGQTGGSRTTNALSQISNLLSLSGVRGGDRILPIIYELAGGWLSLQEDSRLNGVIPH